MPDQDNTAAAIALGERKAEEALARRRTALLRRRQALAGHPQKLEVKTQVLVATQQIGEGKIEATGFLVALGDSWFDYPVYDVLQILEDSYGYHIESAAHRGDPIESMAYHPGQIDKFARCLERVKAHGVSPKAILISGGGDDIAGKEFGMLLNSAESDIGGWNEEIVEGVLSQRISTAYKVILGAVNKTCREQFGEVLPILVHGYDYPVPDGRGFLGGFWFLPGPWLEPGFREKHFDNGNQQALLRNVNLMSNLIDRFNEMLSGIAREQPFSNVRYVDLRNTVHKDLDEYKDWWGNELHPTDKGFAAIADRFAAELSRL